VAALFDCGRTVGRTFLPGLLGHLSGDDLKIGLWLNEIISDNA